MGVDGTTIKLRFLEIENGEDITITTPEGLEIFVMNIRGELTFCNETNNYHEEGVDCVAYPQTNGTWKVKKNEDPNEIFHEREQWKKTTKEKQWDRY